MAFHPGEFLADLVNTGSMSAFPTAPAGNHATDMSVQAGTSAPVGGATTSGGVGVTNATAGNKSTLHWAAGIVLAALILLWFLGAVAFKGVGSS